MNTGSVHKIDKSNYTNAKKKKMYHDTFVLKPLFVTV